MKVILALAVVALVAGLGVRWAKDHAPPVIHHVVDAGLPAKVEGRTWTPINHGKTVRADRVRFEAGRLATVRCHATLGAYSIHIDHAFAFRAAPSAVKPHCPGRQLRTALAHATRLDVEPDGPRERLTLTDGQHHVVATLQSSKD